nr:MAG TPA: phosphoadenosine-phosphosulfate reductase [Caudoviricetes sp.]
MSKHTIDELHQWQALPLSVKIRMTKERIRNWINEFGEDGVYVSFSGGKDSTVLLDLVRKDYPEVKAVFVDVPTQYPELKEFAKTFDNLVILKPKISFAQVCEKYGFPMISKEVSECVYYARKYLKSIVEKLESERTILTDRQIIGSAQMADMLCVERRLGKENYKKVMMEIIPSVLEKAYREAKRNGEKIDCRTKMLFGELEHRDKGIVTNEYSKMYDKSRYKFFLDAPFDLCGNECCKTMKKEPLRLYARESKRVPITAQMASESKLRTQSWLQNGCNAFDSKNPMSNPMSFWTEQDVLLYIKENNLPICSVYGEVVTDYEAMGQCENQMSFADFGISDKEIPLLKTTGCKRTGCVLCGFGCHLEKESRFELLKQTHPKFHNLLYVLKNNGVTYAEAIDWVNEHGGFNIKY